MEASGAAALFMRKRFTKTYINKEDAARLNSCVSGNCKNFAKVGFVLNVK